MTLSRNHWLIRWAFLLTDDDRPFGSVSLCSLFWRSVFETPLKLIIGLIFISVVVHLGFYLPFQKLGWLDLLVVPSIVGGIIGIGFLLAFVDERNLYGKPSLIETAWRGFKDRYCPIIKLEDDDE